MDKKFNSVYILGVRVDKVTMDQAVGLLGGWIKDKGKHYIVTPNPEFIMAAQKDEEFRNVLNKADLAIPDGIGLRLVSDIESTITGVDLMERLCKVACKKGFTVGFLGGRDQVAVKTAECLQKKYHGLKVVLTEDGGEINDDGRWKIEDSNLKVENGRWKIPPIDLLFVAFGQVKQEKWIVKNLPQIPVKVAMGVGGAFDYLSGKVPRAPLWLRNFGLEWLFRLIIQPWRIKRQLNLIKFVLQNFLA